MCMQHKCGMAADHHVHPRPHKRRLARSRKHTFPPVHPAHNSLYNSPTDTQPLHTLSTRALRLAPVGFLAMARRRCAIMLLLLLLDDDTRPRHLRAPHGDGCRE